MRKERQILKYLEEAETKVWYMRSRPCDIPEIEKGRLEAIKKAEKKYPEVLDGFDDWECGYWNGIMSALRYTLGEEKDMLDT